MSEEKVSKRKLKRLRQMASLQSPEAIARDLQLPVDKVRELVREFTGREVKTPFNTPYRASCIVLLAVVIGAPLAITKSGYDYGDLPKRAVIQVGILAAVSLWFLESCLRKRFQLLKCPLDPLLIAGLGLSVVSAAFALNAIRAYTQVFHWACCAAAFFLAFQIFSNSARLRAATLCITISASIIAAIGAVQHLFVFDLIRQSLPPASTFVNRNFAAQFMTIGFPLAVTVTLIARKPATLAMGSGGLLLIIAFLSYSVTRASILAVLIQSAVLVVIFAIARFKDGKRAQVPARNRALLAAAIIASLGAGSLGPLRGGVEDEAPVSLNIVERVGSKGTGSFFVRLRLYRNTLVMLKQHPFLGVGADNFRIHYPATQIEGIRDTTVALGKQPRSGHSDFLQFSAEHGATAFLLFFFMAILLLRGLREVFSLPDHSPPELFFIGTGCFASIAGLAVNAAFSGLLYRAMPPFLLAVVAAALFRIPSISATASRAPACYLEKTGKTALFWSAGAAVIFSLLTVTWARTQYQWTRADRYRGNFMFYATKAPNWDKVLEIWPKVIANNPYRRDNLKFVAVAQMYKSRNREAAATCEQFRQWFPHDPMNLYNLTLCYLRLREYGKAKPVIEHLAAMMPDDPDVKRQLDKVNKGIKAGSRKR